MQSKSTWHFYAEIHCIPEEKGMYKRGSGIVETEKNPQHDSGWYDELKKNILRKLDVSENLADNLMIVSLTKIEAEPPSRPSWPINMTR